MQALDNGNVGKGGLLALQRGEGWRGEGLVNGAQAIRPLRVAFPHVVQQAVWMGEEEGRHQVETLKQAGVSLDPPMLTREME
jgi:hypothetical protein